MKGVNELVDDTFWLDCCTKENFSQPFIGGFGFHHLVACAAPLYGSNHVSQALCHLGRLVLYNKGSAQHLISQHTGSTSNHLNRDLSDGCVHLMAC